jgi:hypothetical protein
VERYVNSLPVARPGEAGDRIREEHEGAVHLGADGLPRRAPKRLRGGLREHERRAGLDAEVHVDRVTVDEPAAEREAAHGRGARSGERRLHEA